MDIVSLSFVHKPEDVQELKALLAKKRANIPVLAKLEKPQAIENLEAIVDETDTSRSQRCGQRHYRRH